MAKGIWVFVEQSQGKIRKVSLELLSQAKILANEKGEELAAVILGQGIGSLAGEAAQYGADKVYLADDAKLAAYTTGAYTSVLAKLIRENEPNLVLFGNTAIGKDLAPRVATRAGVDVAIDCVGIESDAANFVNLTRPIYAGKAFAKVASPSARPIMATVRPNIFPLAEPAAREANVVTVPVSVDEADLRAILKDVISQAAGRVELTEANIIVSGGRGMKGPENYVMLEDLADVLGAAVGASRAAVDSGWKEHKFQVGQTGKTVSPTLYIACGISGAIQHLAGMGSSKVIVAINKDPEANIFAVADYGIVGDLFQVVPVLTEECKKLMA